MLLLSVYLQEMLWGIKVAFQTFPIAEFRSSLISEWHLFDHIEGYVEIFLSLS